MSAVTDVDPLTAARRLARSERLSRRRYVVLPLTGPGAAFTEVQGRLPGSPSVAPEELAELISSIATVGLLQPILVEELEDGRRRLVAGERRLRAVKWLATSQSDARYQTIPAVVCPGPLPEEDRRTWQLIENLAREDLRPGELAAALLFERCSVLTAKLLAAGVTVPADVASLDDPVARFRALDRLRLASGQSRCGAPWPEVLRRLGVQIPAHKAKQLVRAFAALPPELSAEMDAAKIALHTRLRYLELDRGNRAAAAELWEAVKRRARPELLTAAVRTRLGDPTCDADDAVEAAAALHAAANAARAEQQSSDRAGEPAAPGAAQLEGPGAATQVPGDLVAAAVAALEALLDAIDGGAILATYDAGSLRLHTARLTQILAVVAGEAAA